MDLIKPPSAGDDCRQLWKPVAELAKYFNALAGLKIVASQVRSKLTLTEGSAILELIPGAGGTAASEIAAWHMYPSAWQGAGDDPVLSSRKMRWRMIPGEISNRKPTNMQAEFGAFGDPAETVRLPENAVVTFVYMEVPCGETTLGKGDLLVGRPTIKTAQGTATSDLVDLIGAVPVFGDDGSLPAYAVVSLGEIHYFGGALHFYPGRRDYLSLSLANGGDCTSAIRNFQVV